MVTVKLSSKNQITVPSQVRRQLRIASGDRICFEAMQDGRFIVASVSEAVHSDGAARRRLEKVGKALSPSSMDAVIGASVLSDDQRIKRSTTLS